MTRAERLQALADIGPRYSTLCRERLLAADAETVKAGLVWYADAHRALASTPIGIVRAAGVAAALSPQVPWEDNLMAALELAHGREIPTVIGLGLSRDRAQRIANGEHPVRVLGGPKTRSFFRNLLRPQGSAVTLDTWMMRIDGREYPRYWRKGEYRAYADAVRSVAAEYGLVPGALQAILWLQMRGEAETERERLAALPDAF